MKKIAFSPPDIGQAEIDSVVEALKSGWITTGPKTKEFERQIAAYLGASRAVCLNSATAALELTLRILGVGPGDEVITSAYTYTASASVICHLGATPVLVDVAKDSTELDMTQLERAVTMRTKAVIPVEIAGIPCDYAKIKELLDSKSALFSGNTGTARHIGRAAIVVDAAHSFGAEYHNKRVGGAGLGDFTCFSFHAVKNLTTGEGGAVTFSDTIGTDVELIYKKYMLLSLHGQNKDALAKTRLGSWEYDILSPDYKCNMTDISAALGLAQLARYDSLLATRRDIISRYDDGFKGSKITPLSHNKPGCLSSGHLYITRVAQADEERRNGIIQSLAGFGIAANVHYKPLPMLTAYKKLGFKIENFPNAYDYYRNEITLPLHTLLSNSDVAYIIEKYLQLV